MQPPATASASSDEVPTDSNSVPVVEAPHNFSERCNEADNFSDQTTPPHQPFIIEMFAGSARVTACLRFLGLHGSFGVDHILQNNIAKVIPADLTTESGQSLFWTWVESPHCYGVFAAPPCGTCSLARNIKIRIPGSRRKGGPPPLRSSKYPDGLPHLTTSQRARVDAANALYAFLTQVILFCIKHGKMVCVENPRSSLYWLTSYAQPLVKQLRFTAHQACAYGGFRPKWTALLHNHPGFQAICKTCPGESVKHIHKPWGYDLNKQQFSTKEEAAYPVGLAYEIACVFANEAVSRGWIPPLPQLEEGPTLQHLRAVTAIQPRASKLPPLVPEFKTLHHRKRPLTEPDPCLPGSSLSDSWQGIPAGAKYLKRTPLRSTRDDTNTIDTLPHKNMAFGVYHSPDEFVEEAVKAGHPSQWSSVLPQALTEALEKNLIMTSKQLCRVRLQTLTEWSNMAKDLQQEEDCLHNSMPSSARAILKGKRILLWKKLLELHGYDDLGVADEMLNGVDLLSPVGQVPSMTPMFKPATRSITELKEGARASRDATLSNMRGSGDDEIDAEVYRKTLDEKADSWISGPIDPGDLPEQAVINRRFGIRQGGKIRLIDDFSASGVNGCVQANASPFLHTLDFIAALLKALNVKDRNRQWVGKTFDLASAYRQMVVAESSSWVSYVAVYNPSTDKAEIYQMKALPFGATKSVYSFLRVAHSIWYLGAKCLALIWTSYFDDFVCLSNEECDTVTSGCVTTLFSLLGWKVSGGDKDLPFDKTFKALGIQISLNDWTRGSVLMQNTEKRIFELNEAIDKAIKEGSLSCAAALSLRGRMQFANSQVWGRASRICLKHVTSHAYSNGSGEIDEALATALSTFRKTLNAGRAREIVSGTGKPRFVFTDASFEPSDDNWPAGIGGVLYDEHGDVLKHFSYCLKSGDLAKLGFPEHKKLVIFETEMIAVMVALEVWKHDLMNLPVIIFVDNNSARDVAISGSARTTIPLQLVKYLLELEDSIAIIPWYARVPSKSNPADEPSRCEGPHVSLGQEVPQEEVAVTIQDILSKIN